MDIFPEAVWRSVAKMNISPEAVLRSANHALTVLPKVALWTVGGYFGILFISPFVAG